MRKEKLGGNLNVHLNLEHWIGGKSYSQLKISRF
jgi:hypothetical protein